MKKAAKSERVRAAKTPADAAKTPADASPPFTIVVSYVTPDTLTWPCILTWQ